MCECERTEEGVWGRVFIHLWAIRSFLVNNSETCNMAKKKKKPKNVHF